MKKFIFSLFAVLAISLAFVSCKTEADDHVEITSVSEMQFLTEGTWSGTMAGQSVEGMTIDQDALAAITVSFLFADECYTNKKQTIFYLNSNMMDVVIDLKKD